jgi:hypothetical protein
MDDIFYDPTTRLWWKECEPCQESFHDETYWKIQNNVEHDPHQLFPSDGKKGPWWTPLECVSHCGYWPIQYSNELYDPDFMKHHPS